MSKCIITGCRFVIQAEGRSVWGDLHSVSGEVCVFNGVTRAAGTGNCAYREANWEYAYPAPDKDEKQAILIGTADYFENRGIITCRQQDVWLNDAVKQYLGEQ